MGSMNGLKNTKMIKILHKTNSKLVVLVELIINNSWSKLNRMILNNSNHKNKKKKKNSKLRMQMINKSKNKLFLIFILIIYYIKRM